MNTIALLEESEHIRVNHTLWPSETQDLYAVLSISVINTSNEVMFFQMCSRGQVLKVYAKKIRSRSGGWSNVRFLNLIRLRDEVIQGAGKHVSRQ